MNTTRAKPSPASTSGKGLGQAGASALKNLKVSLYVDQDGQHKLCLQTSRGQRFLDATEALANPNTVLKSAAELGVLAWGHSSRATLIRMLEEQTEATPCVTAYKPGFVFSSGKKKRAFAYVNAGAEVIMNEDDDTLIVAQFKANSRIGRSGSKKKSLAALGRFTKNQPIPQFLLHYSLTPLLLDFVPVRFYVENTLVELFGSTTSAKSALATTVAGSPWGGSSHKTHAFLDFNSTVNKIEAEMANFNATLMGLDESTQQQGDAHQRRAAIANLIHRLSSGHSKGRLHQSDGETFKTMVVVTSNDPSTQGLDESQSVAGGLNVRYIGIQVPDRETKFLEFFPDGVATIQEVIEELHENATENYGHIARDMVKAILRSQTRDPDELPSLIAKYMGEYLAYNKIEKSDAYRYRHLKPVALAYAAGRIAKDWNVLPEEHFGGFLKPMSRLLKYIAGNNSKKASEEGLGFFLRYVRKNADKFHEVERRQPIVMSDKKFYGCLGLIGHSKDGRPFLAIPPSRMGKGSLKGYEPHLKLLKRQGHLVFDQGTLQTKVRLRTASESADLSSDRVYKIMIPAWPLK